MSRNKDIKLLHQMTKLPYKECRRYMKANHWNFMSAYFAASGLDKLPSELLESVNNMVKSLSEALANLFQSLGESLIEISKNMKGEV